MTSLSVDQEQKLVAHVQRAGDLLKAGDLPGAEREGEAAQGLAPSDTRTKNLLGLLRFRGGKFEEARAIYLELVATDPDDPALRLNLGLVELRMGRNAEAAVNLRRLVDKEPSTQKAQGYLGLALMRSGDLKAAHAAFVAAGQHDLVRQVAAQLAGQGEAVPEPIGVPKGTSATLREATAKLGGRAVLAPAQPKTEPRMSPPASVLALNKAEEDEAAGVTASTSPPPAPAVSSSEPTLAAPVPAPAPEAIREPAAAASLSGVAVDVVAPGAGLEVIEESGAMSSLTAARVRAVEGEAPLGLRGPVPLSEYVRLRDLKAPTAAETFHLAEGGLLVVRVAGHLPTRISGALVSSGTLGYAPLARRMRATPTEEAFGDGEDPVCLASGQGVMVVSPRGGTFTVIGLREDVVYVREPMVFAFNEDLAWENGRIPGSGGTRVVQFRGEGNLVLRTDRDVYTMRLSGNEVYYADGDALVGWTGQVVPQQLRGVDGSPTPYVACTGEGAVILVDAGSPPKSN